MGQEFLHGESIQARTESNIVFDEKPAVASRTGARHVDARGGESAQVGVDLKIA